MVDTEKTHDTSSDGEVETMKVSGINEQSQGSSELESSDDEGRSGYDASVTDMSKDASNPSVVTTSTPSNITRDTVTKVVILAYYRGGSTFVGDLFNQNDDVFYWFEPLMAPMEDIKLPGSAFHAREGIFLENEHTLTE